MIMKRNVFYLGLLVLLVVAMGPEAVAQIKLPPASSAQKVTQGLGINDVELTYNRPSMRGRQIFGGLVPYGEVWRTGANTVSSITFAESVTVAGQAVPAGTYGILTIPNPQEWTVILSKNSQQWGSYSYSEDEDQLRFKVKPTTLANAVETFTIDFADVTTNSLRVNISWENTQVGFDVTVDQDAAIMASIDEAMKGEKKPYFPAAQYYYNNGKDINKALEWVNEAEKANDKAPHIKYWKARIQLKAGDKAGAAATATRGVDIAKAAGNSEYVKLNGDVLEQARR